MPKTTTARSPNSLGVFKDHETDWVFKRTLEYMSEKAAEIGDCLFAANRIDERSRESWIVEWAALAGRVEQQAHELLEKGQIISAREGLLRASNYYRTAEYGTPPSDQRARLLWQKSVDCFHQACPLFDPPVLPVEIPFEGKVLPGYFWSPDSSGKPRPTLIAVGGNDSSGEEIFFSSGPGAVRHGYNYFTFEYPGHRGAVYLNPAFVKRPDYQPVFKAAIDFLQTLPGVDQRIALSGFSFGGYVVSQVAVHEKRIKAVIPDSPIVNLNGVFEDFWAPAFRKLRFFPRSIRKIIVERQINKSPLKAAMAQYSLWTWGMAGKSMLDWLEGGYAKAFSVVDDLPKIECAALALVSEDEGAELVRQAKLFYDCISSTQKNIHIFSLSKDGSNDHCQLDNISRAHQVIFEWLDKVLK